MRKELSPLWMAMAIILSSTLTGCPWSKPEQTNLSCPSDSYVAADGSCKVIECAALHRSDVTLGISTSGSFKLPDEATARSVSIAGKLRLYFREPVEELTLASSSLPGRHGEPAPALPPAAFRTYDHKAWKFRPDAGTELTLQFADGKKAVLQWSDCAKDSTVYPAQTSAPCLMSDYRPADGNFSTVFLGQVRFEDGRTAPVKLALSGNLLEGLVTSSGPLVFSTQIGEKEDEIPEGMPATGLRDCDEQEQDPVPPDEDDPNEPPSEGEALSGCTDSSHEVNSGMRVNPWGTK